MAKTIEIMLINNKVPLLHTWVVKARLVLPVLGKAAQLINNRAEIVRFIRIIAIVIVCIYQQVRLQSVQIRNYLLLQLIVKQVITLNNPLSRGQITCHLYHSNTIKDLSPPISSINHSIFPNHSSLNIKSTGINHK